MRRIGPAPRLLLVVVKRCNTGGSKRVRSDGAHVRIDEILMPIDEAEIPEPGGRSAHLASHVLDDRFGHRQAEQRQVAQQLASRLAGKRD
jgi:hypothetical protein